MATKKNAKTQGPITLTAYEVARLNAANDKHNARLAAELPVYPDHDADTLREMLLGDGALGHLEQLGWQGHNLFQTFEDYEAEDLRGRRSRRGRRGRGRTPQPSAGKGRGKGGSGGGGGKTLMNPQVVLGVVQKLVTASGLKAVGMTGEVVWGEQNFEFLTKQKAAWFIDSYKLYIPLAHIWLCAEITLDGLKEIAKATGYTAYASVENTRGQAVGLLVHPRLKVLGDWSVDEVANVQGVADLRPLYGLDLEDTAAGVPAAEKNFSAGAVHLKSMRGGPATSGKVRAIQAGVIATKVTGKKIIVGGDWNTFLDRTSDLTALTAAGWVLYDPKDTRSTQSMGGRLDGYFGLNFPKTISSKELFAWFSDPTIGRGLTDHGALLDA